MNFTFLHRPEPRKYNYKPQFYVPDDKKPINEKDFNPDKFGEKLRSNWERRRYSRKNSTGNMRTVIWLIFIIAMLVVVGWKFLL